MVNIHSENASEKQLLFNETYMPIFEKKKVLSANGRTVFQLLDTMRLNNNRTINSCKTTTKTHATMNEKIAVPLCVEHLHFLLKICAWKVTKRSLEVIIPLNKKKFKKDFVIMNQVSRKKAKTDVGKYFFKLINNANFGHDCYNNTDNCYFSPIYVELEVLMHSKRHQNIFEYKRVCLI